MDISYESVSFAILVVLQVVGISLTVWQLFRSSRNGLSTLITEKNGPHAGDVSFSRVAGLLGALTLTTLFISNVFWAHRQMFGDGGLAKAGELWPIYLFGTALFAPYAFNRLAMIGQPDASEKKNSV